MYGKYFKLNIIFCMLLWINKLSINELFLWDIFIGRLIFGVVYCGKLYEKIWILIWE